MISAFDAQSKYRSLERPRVIVMSNNPIGLGIIRNLQGYGLELLCLVQKVNFVCSSRYLSNVIDIDIEKEPDRLLRVLINKGEQLPEKGFILPTSEIELMFLATNRGVLSEYYLLSLSKEKVVSIIVDKYLLHQELLKLSFNSPHTLLLDSINSIDKIRNEISYPCLLKPVFSGDWKTDRSYSVMGVQKAIVIHNEQDLVASYNLVSSISPKVLLQEIVQADEHGTYSFCCYADKSGKVLWGFVTQKILQYPKNFGTALLCQTVVEPEISDLGKRVVEALGIDGISEVEIMTDKKSGLLYVIEINIRHWLQHTQSTRLGVNISLLDYYYRTGKMDETNRVLSMASQNAKPVMWIDDFGYLFHCIKNYFSFNSCKFNLFKGKHWEFAVFSLKDFSPFFSLLRGKIKGI